jgi:hypothetical protein
MKYSNFIGIAAAVILITCCFFPWIYIPAINTTITGFFSGNTNFGKPAILNVVFTIIAITCFLMPMLGAKRLNLFVCALNLAWAIRNLLILSTCEMGECPQKQPALFVLVAMAIIMMIMSLFPKVEIKQNGK